MKAKSLLKLIESCEDDTELFVLCGSQETGTHSVTFYGKENRITIIPKNECCEFLTEREKWLMFQAFNARTNHTSFNTWLEDKAANAVTVEIVLVKDAPL